jgi:hypothetical protein
MRRVAHAATAVADDTEEVNEAAAASGGGASDERRSRAALASGKITILGCKKAKKTGRKRAIQCNFELFS